MQANTFVLRNYQPYQYILSQTILNLHDFHYAGNLFKILCFFQGNTNQKVSVHLMITIQKVTSNVESTPRQFPHIY
jgi:hypothetical protein